jgi:hypothetical protein
MHYTPGGNRTTRVSVGAVFGATAALFVGILAAMTASAGEFTDLAARAVLVPLGAVIGAVLGYRTWRE